MDALYTELMEKQRVLYESAVTLKQEFVGLDTVIDEITERISPWYLFPQMQQRPLVINLWGLTGTGKTSLIERLAQLLQFQDLFYHFDLGETDHGHSSIKNSLEEIYAHANGFPAIIAFDEFQHARTINEVGAENRNSELRIVWQLMDSGKFQFPRDNYYLENLHKLIQKLRYMLGNGVRAKNGYVSEGRSFYQQMITEHYDYEDSWNKPAKPQKKNQPVRMMFFPASHLERLHSLTRSEFICVSELKKRMLTMDGEETITFLEKVFSRGNSPRVIDCSRSLIFVLGNLDEVYNMSANFNPDLDADEFHKQSLLINLPQVKQALRQRFRNEQIARLGNNHIIYPAFSRKTYEDLIRMELNKVSEKVLSMQNIRMHFAPSLCQLIYREGVYPTQGTRPVFSTLHQLVTSKLGKILSEMVLKKVNATDITLEGRANALKAIYHKGDETQHVLHLPLQLNLEKLRKEKCDDMQAISAVHESGHAIISAILLKTVPELIFSSSVESESAGFVLGKFKWKYISQKEILPRLAMFLGGIAAEKQIFGEENITTGAQEDIVKATEFVTDMLKSCAWRGMAGAYHVESVETNSFLHDPTYKINTLAEEYLIRARKLAENTLKEQETLLIHMACYLSDRRQMKKNQFHKMLKQHAVNFDTSSLIENGDLLFYRSHLKEKMEKLKTQAGKQKRSNRQTQWPMGVQLNHKYPGNEFT